MQQCKSQKRKLTWYKKNAFKTIAVMSRNGPKIIDFDKTDKVLQDRECRKSFHQMLYGNNDDNHSLDDQQDEENEELITIQNDYPDFELRVMGIIRFVNSDHVLFFFTSKHGVYDYIHSQLENLLNEIDWSKLTFVAIAEGYRAVMRLKLSTVNLIATPCYNVRKQTLVPMILAGRNEYFATWMMRMSKK